LKVTGLQDSTGTTLCVDGSNNVIKCSGQTLNLQNAYNGGNTITTTDNRDIAFTLADTTTDSNFSITTANGSTGSTILSLADGASSTVPTQLLKIDNKATSNTLPAGIVISSSGGGPITNGIDLSDAAIVNALLLGTNDVS